MDLIFRDEDCLVFVEVKTRLVGGWTRPAAAFIGQTKAALSKCSLLFAIAEEPARKSSNSMSWRCVLNDGKWFEVRHSAQPFAMSAPYRYG